ncbi:class I SAM-dependent methyltransferase [Candidatus Falkowbacteria bacterium]|nr:class I SAM-dependent methyltransferase [Candidatus Falkowbacteria bacterium]
MKYYDKQNNRLIFTGNNADSFFWDKQWEIEDFKEAVERNGRRDRFVSSITKKFLPANKSIKILEGGCGMGHFVYSLDLRGYDAYGIDFAENVVGRLNKNFPDLKIYRGNVRNLNFGNEYFDAYWSLGVIEHFFGGYEKISDEMRRAIKKNGYLFITFPHLSLLRKIKAKLGRYPFFTSANFKEGDFYQFALDYNGVVKHFQRKGFSLVYKKSFDGVKGMEEESGFLAPLFRKIYNGKSIFLKIARFAANKIFSVFAGHIILLAFKKDEKNC